MKVYLVCFYVDYENVISSKSKVFKEKETAEKYCDELNKALAAAYDCEVEDLDERFYCEEMELI